MAISKKARLANIKDEVTEFHPLLHKLLPKLPNVKNVEYTHGTTEMGADFVISKFNDTFEYIEYIGVIAKTGRIVQDLSEIEKQIEECAVPRLFLGGKERIRLDEIWIIVTGNITKGAQEKIHEKYRSRKITFVNGERLEKLIDQYLSAFWTDVGIEVGEYLNLLRTSNSEIDKKVSLLQISDKSFYVEQDIYECSPPDYKIKRKNKNEDKKVNIIEVIDKEKIILIEGSMGSGKSKLIRRLIEEYTEPDIFLNKKLLPISITYSEILDRYSKDVNKLIEARISESLRSELEDAEYLILIDGVDEKNLPVKEQLEALGALIANLKNTKNIKAVITSRYLRGLNRAKNLEGEIARYYISPLSTSRTIEFITKICSKLNIKSRIIEDLKKSQLFKELPKSPIAAILLANLINDNSKDLPSNMTELYSKYMELILGRWDIEKGLQSQKEYQALNNIMMDLAKYLLENELTIISIDDAKEVLKKYLEARNLGISVELLFQKMVDRCEIVVVDLERHTFSFKHRTFAEFFYANALVRDTYFPIDERAFDFYWMNTYFFYLGIQKDCPDILKALLAFSPSSDFERLLKVSNMGSYFLAAYASPYGIITDGLLDTILGAAKLYQDIVSLKIDSLFSKLPRMHILFFIQYILRESYSYEFFKNAIEEIALKIDEGSYDEDLKAYALFFLSVIYNDIGGRDSFNFLLKNHPKLPLDLEMAIGHEAKNLKEQNALIKKQDKRVKKMIKGNESLIHKIHELYEKPVNSLPSKK